MSTITPDAPETTETVAAPQKMVTFMSRGENQVLTRKRTHHVTDPLTNQRRVQTEDEWRAENEAANEVRRREDKEPIEYDRSPWKIQFEGNTYRTDDPVIIDWLRGLDLFNFNGPSGFWELVEPVDVNDLEPTTEVQLQDLQRALMTHDPAAAEAVLDREKQTHNRPQVLKAAASAVESLRELIADATGEAPPKGSTPSTSRS